ERREVGRLQLPGPCRPEPFAGIVPVPQVEVADLRALGSRDPADVADLDLPGPTRTDRHREIVDDASALGLGTDATVEVLVNGDCGAFVVRLGQSCVQWHSRCPPRLKCSRPSSSPCYLLPANPSDRWHRRPYPTG